MASQSWLDSHRPGGPLRLAQRAGISQPVLQRAALCSLGSAAPARLLLQRLGRGRLLAAELRFPGGIDALATLVVELDGARVFERRWSAPCATDIASEVFDFTPALVYRQSLRCWIGFGVGAAPPWAAIEVAIDPGQLQSFDACARPVSLRAQALAP